MALHIKVGEEALVLIDAGSLDTVYILAKSREIRAYIHLAENG